QRNVETSRYSPRNDVDALLREIKMRGTDAHHSCPSSPYHGSAVKSLAVSPLDARLNGVAKVSLKVSSQVIDSTHSLCADLNVSYVITYATCQELYFQLFVSLARRSVKLLRNAC